jgi:hypothetical protein
VAPVLTAIERRLQVNAMGQGQMAGVSPPASRVAAQ